MKWFGITSFRGQMVSRVSKRRSLRRKQRQSASRALLFDRLENRRMLTADISDWALTMDTGSDPDDLITSEPAIMGTLEWTDPDTTAVTVEFDHDEDGTAEDSWYVEFSGDWISYDPLMVDAALETWEGNFPLQYRTIEHQSAGDVTNAWTYFSYTLDRVAPSISSYTPVDNDVLSSAPTSVDIVFSEDIDPSTADFATVEAIGMNNSRPDQSAATTTADTISITFSSTVEAGPYETWADSITDMAGNTMEMSHIVPWRISAAPTTAGIDNVTVEEDSGDIFVSLSSYFTDEYDDPTTMTYEIVSNTNDTPFDSYYTCGSDLTIMLAENQFGTSDMTIRATDTDGMTVTSTFTIDVTSVNDAPEIINFAGIFNGVEWEFEGTVIDENPVGLQVSLGGDISATVNVTDPSGYFIYTVVAVSPQYANATTTDIESMDSDLVEWYGSP